MSFQTAEITSELTLLQQTVDSQAERIRCLENLVDHLPLDETTMRLHKSPPITVPATCSTELEQAEFLVNVPNVVLVLSGDPIAAVGWPSVDVAERRGALVYNVARLCSTTSATAQIVFDGNLSGICPPSLYEHNVEVRLSNQPVSSDQAVHELVQTYPKKKPLVLVTNNPALRSVSVGRVNCIPTEFFLDLFLN